MRSNLLLAGITAAVLGGAPAAAQSLGTPYCTANPNSTGTPSAISATGSGVVQMNDVTLACDALPLSSFGFFVVSRDQSFVANPGGSAGNLCLGGSIGRYSLSILNSGATGSVSLAIDLANIPHPTTPFAVTPGDTLNFQYWHRDAAAGGGATSNFSEGLEVQFAGGPPPPSWANDVYPLLDTQNSLGFACSDCHGGQCGIDLSDAQTAFTHLVGVAASCCPGETYVVPGDASTSLLYQKLLPGPQCGNQMPLVGTFPGDPNVIRDWINAGALNN